jgi:hypothetical protein
LSDGTKIHRLEFRHVAPQGNTSALMNGRDKGDTPLAGSNIGLVGCEEASIQFVKFTTLYYDLLWREIRSPLRSCRIPD